jgi:hypothetical protein
MTIKHLFAAIAIIALTPSANAKDCDIPEIGATLSLSDRWFPVDAGITKAYNDYMIRLSPQTTTRYILGFTRGNPPGGFESSTEYLWIQRTPMPTPPITPEQLTAMFPKTMSEIKPEFERLLKDKISSMDPGAAHYEQRLGAVVWDGSLTLPNGSIAKMRSYLIVTRTSVISVNAYATPQTAETVFEEVQGIVSTLKMKEDQKMPQTWIDRLKQLLGSSR